MTASLIVAFVAELDLGPFSYRDASEAIGGHAALWVQEAEADAALATMLADNGATVIRARRVRGVRIVPLVGESRKSSASDSNWLEEADESSSVTRRVAAELAAQLASSRRQTELLALLIRACGLADDIAAVLEEMERLNPTDTDDVQAWMQGDGSQWVRRPSGSAELWLDI